MMYYIIMSRWKLSWPLDIGQAYLKCEQCNVWSGVCGALEGAVPQIASALAQLPSETRPRNAGWREERRGTMPNLPQIIPHRSRMLTHLLTSGAAKCSSITPNAMTTGHLLTAMNVKHLERVNPISSAFFKFSQKKTQNNYPWWQCPDF